MFQEFPRTSKVAPMNVLKVLKEVPKKVSKNAHFKTAKVFNNTSKQIPKLPMINPKSCSIDGQWMSMQISIVFIICIHSLWDHKSPCIIIVHAPTRIIQCWNVGRRLLEENIGMSKMDDKWAWVDWGSKQQEDRWVLCSHGPPIFSYGTSFRWVDLRSCEQFPPLINEYCFCKRNTNGYFTASIVLWDLFWAHASALNLGL